MNQSLVGQMEPESYPYERRVIFFTCVGHGLMHTYMLIFPGILVLLTRHFGLSLAQVGVLGFPCYLMLGLGSLPAGYLADRWSGYKVFLLFFFASAGAAMLAAWSKSVWTLGASLGLLGLVASLYHPIGLALISMGVRRKGLVMGLHGNCGNIGLAVAPFAAALIGEHYGWQAAFMFPAVLSLLLGGTLLAFPIKVGLQHVQSPQAEKNQFPNSWGRALVWLYAAMTMTGFAYRGLMTYLPKYLGEKVSLEWISAIVAGGLFASIALGFGGVGQIWGGHLSDRTDPSRLYLRLVLLYMPLLLLATFFSGLTMVMLLCVFSFFFFSGQPVENQMLAWATPPKLRSTGYGLKFGLNFGVGALAAPVCGWVGDRMGMDWIFYTLAFFLLLAFLGVYKMRREILKAAHG